MSKLKRLNQQHQNTEGESYTGKTQRTKKTQNTHMHTHTKIVDKYRIHE